VTFVNDSFYANPEFDGHSQRGHARTGSRQARRAVQKGAADPCRGLPLVWLIDVQYVSVFNRKLHDHTTGPAGTQQAFERAWLET